jgi:twinkle protein
VPSLYDIEQSASWYNKGDHGMIIERPNPEGNEAIIHMAKVRFRGTGRKGSVRMMFDPHTDRFNLLNAGEL